ncbi:hypothetical protein H5410_005170 [Solanum commersonii]|uniref:Uncharacterized protein n=1 Tax=Solanum commersonii TaxID=4109 RepID=A0A9J6A6F0_SOLCO|nr:hypothetical protein H5410_005170 [Solanum commersonii]
MKQPPNIPTRYIGQFFKGSELEIAICVGSQGSATLFQRLKKVTKKTYLFIATHGMDYYCIDLFMGGHGCT